MPIHVTAILFLLQQRPFCHPGSIRRRKDQFPTNACCTSMDALVQLRKTCIYFSSHPSSYPAVRRGCVLFVPVRCYLTILHFSTWKHPILNVKHNKLNCSPSSLYNHLPTDQVSESSLINHPPADQAHHHPCTIIYQHPGLCLKFLGYVNFWLAVITSNMAFAFVFADAHEFFPLASRTLLSLTLPWSYPGSPLEKLYHLHAFHSWHPNVWPSPCIIQLFTSIASPTKLQHTGIWKSAHLTFVHTPPSLTFVGTLPKSQTKSALFSSRITFLLTHQLWAIFVIKSSIY